MELVRGVPAVSRENISRLVNPPEPEPASQTAVRKAISSMCTRYFDPITLNEIASEVFVSPFHFSRIFAKTVGLTPGRYLTALRLFEAKRLLLSTSLTVSDVVCSVGYSSVGTFTNRFTKAVGMTPTQYRDPEVRDLLVALAPHYQRLPPADVLEDVGESETSVGPGEGTITGRVALPHWAPPADTLVGAFAEEVPQSGPAAFTVLRGSQSPRFTIRGVPDGRWTVIAMAAHATPSGPGSPSAPPVARLRCPRAGRRTCGCACAACGSPTRRSRSRWRAGRAPPGCARPPTRVSTCAPRPDRDRRTHRKATLMTTDDIDRNRTDTVVGDDGLLLPFPPEQGRVGDLGHGLVWSDVVAAIERHDKIGHGWRRDSAA